MFGSDENITATNQKIIEISGDKKSFNHDYIYIRDSILSVLGIDQAFPKQQLNTILSS